MNKGTSADLEQEIKTIVSKIIKVDESRIDPDANIFSEYGVDSLLGVEILAGLDKKYGLDISEQKIREMKTLNDIIRIAKEMIPKKAVPVLTFDMSKGTSEYWRKLIRADEAASEDFLKEFRSPLEVFRPLFFAIMNFLCKFYFQIKVSGLANIPKTLPYIIAPNHSSALDQTMVSCAIGREKREQLYTLAVKHFYDRPVARVFMKIAANVMRIDSEKDFLPALRAAVKVLKLGRSIYINPEGTRSESGELLPFRVGVGMLAAETGVPIVPVYIEGTFRSMPPGSTIPKPSRISVTFGKPIYMEEYLKRKKTETAYDVYKAITDELFKRVSSLKVRKENL